MARLSDETTPSTKTADSKVRLDVEYLNEPSGFSRPFTSIDVFYNDEYNSTRPAVVVDAEPLGRFEISHAECADRGLSPSIVADLPLKAVFDLADISRQIKLTSGKFSLFLKRKQDYFRLVTDLRANVAKVESTVVTHGEHISKLEADLKVLQEKAELLTVTLDADRKRNDGEFLSVRKDIIALRETDAEHKKSHDELVKNHTELKEFTKNVSTDFESLKAEYSKSTSEFRAQNVKFNSELTTIKGNIATIKTDATALTNTVSNLSSKMGPIFFLCLFDSKMGLLSYFSTPVFLPTWVLFHLVLTFLE
jgi:hypothetical protein